LNEEVWEEYRSNDENISLIQIEKGNDNYRIEESCYNTIVRYLKDNLSFFYNNPNKVFNINRDFVRSNIKSIKTIGIDNDYKYNH
jgi:hypothetical protein